MDETLSVGRRSKLTFWLYSSWTDVVLVVNIDAVAHIVNAEVTFIVKSVLVIKF